MTKRKLTYDNVLAMLDKMIENAEHWANQPGQTAGGAYYAGQIKALNEVSHHIRQAQDGCSSMLDCRWLTDAPE